MTQDAAGDRSTDPGPGEAAGEILLAGARALAHVDGLGPSLRILLDAIAGQLRVGSAVVVLVGETPRLSIAATYGLGDDAAAGLARAIGDPGHPIARTITAQKPTFDVLPTAPGGPALRSHLPLMVTRDGSQRVVGVLALAHDHPIDPSWRPVVLAGADLAAVAIEQHRR